jgi:hypothetical protein
LFIFSTPELIRNLWQLKTAVFLHWCLICAVPQHNKLERFAIKIFQKAGKPFVEGVDLLVLAS